jgi:outer membrane murein-binding lipoprotein Lpp
MMIVKLKFLAAAPVVLFLAGCAKDINNKEALRAAVIEHLNERQGKIGLSMDAMDVSIGAMEFQKDQAKATVNFKPKQGGEGMNIPYAFERKGEKWVVRSRMETGPGGHGAGQPIPSSEPGAAPPMGTMPPGHPATTPPPSKP